MPFKLLSNLIKSPAVHQAGEIVDLDAATAENLKKRGIVQEVEAAATHLFGQTKENGSLGGKPVNEEASPAAPPQPAATPAADSVPQTTTTHANPIGPSANSHMPSVSEQQQNQPPQPAANAQPSPEEVAATAAQVK